MLLIVNEVKKKPPAPTPNPSAVIQNGALNRSMKMTPPAPTRWATHEAENCKPNNAYAFARSDSCTELLASN